MNGLDERQLLHVRTFGFVILREALTPSEMETVLAEQELAMRDVPVQREPVEQLVCTMGPSTPFLAAWLEQPRFVAIAQQIMGADVIGACSYVMRYVGDTGWHVDDYSTELPGVKFVAPCAPVRAGSGALRVVPGTHKLPMDDRTRDVYSREIGAVPAYVCEAAPGDVVVFDNRIWHASSGGSSDRRACYLYFLRNPHTEAEVAAARGLNSLTLQMRERYGALAAVPRAWFDDAHRFPLRRRWIARMRELGWLDVQDVGLTP